MSAPLAFLSRPRAARMVSGEKAGRVRPWRSQPGMPSVFPSGSAPGRKRELPPAALSAIRSSSLNRCSSSFWRAARSSSPPPAAFSASFARRPRLSWTSERMASPDWRGRRLSRVRASARRAPVIRCCTESEAAVDAGFRVLWAAEAGACFSAFTVPCCRKMAASFLLPMASSFIPGASLLSNRRSGFCVC